MSRNYDNWERLVAAVIKRQQIWELCHQHSRSPSICSEASSSISDFSSTTTEIQIRADRTEQYEPSLEEKMSKNYDNWGRLVGAVIKREEDQLSIKTPSIYFQTSSSDFGSSFRWSNVKLENNQESFQKPIPKLISINSVLKSSSRELGKGRFGTSILMTRLRENVKVSDKDFLAKGTQLVMKKLLGEVKVTEEEFKIVFGNCRHENVAAPRAYYFSDKGNYIFNDYHSLGSVYDMLHGASYQHLSWKSRLMIATGAGRGMAHIHGQGGGKLVHGNISSTNIFVNSKDYGCVSDFGLADIMRMPGGQGDASQESDVYSFGVVLLELLTGRSPLEPKGFGEYLHIVDWAHSIRPEDWSSKLFDDQISVIGYSDQFIPGYILCDEIEIGEFYQELKIKNEGKMVEMFQLATRCLASCPVDRPKMIEVVFMLEDMCKKTLRELYTNKLIPHLTRSLSF